MAKNKDSADDAVQTISIPIDPNLNADTREALIRELAPKGSTGIVGNLADIQRAGAAIVKGEGSDLAAAKQVDEAVNSAVDAAAAQSAGDANTGASISGGDSYNPKG